MICFAQITRDKWRQDQKLTDQRLIRSKKYRKSECEEDRPRELIIQLLELRLQLLNLQPHRSLQRHPLLLRQPRQQPFEHIQHRLHRLAGALRLLIEVDRLLRLHRRFDLFPGLRKLQVDLIHLLAVVKGSSAGGESMAAKTRGERASHQAEGQEGETKGDRCGRFREDRGKRGEGGDGFVEEKPSASPHRSRSIRLEPTWSRILRVRR
ncbi:unnamed protein product [Musa acuminata var. zebrina]